MSEKAVNQPTHFLDSAEICLENNDPAGAVDFYIRAASAYQELQEYRKAAKYYSTALRLIEQETSNDEMLSPRELSHLYKLRLAKNSCLFNLGIIHIWLQKYSLAKLFFVESHKPLNRANSLLKEHKEYFSNLIDPQIKDIVGITPLQTELLTFGFSSSVFSFLSAILDNDTERNTEYLSKLKKLETLFISDFEFKDNSFFELLEILSESISETDLILFNEIATRLDEYYTDSLKNRPEISEAHEPRIKLLDSFLSTFEDELLKIFDDLRTAFFNDLDKK